MNSDGDSLTNDAVGSKYCRRRLLHRIDTRTVCLLLQYSAVYALHTCACACACTCTRITRSRSLIWHTSILRFPLRLRFQVSIPHKTLAAMRHLSTTKLPAFTTPSFNTRHFPPSRSSKCKRIHATPTMLRVQKGRRPENWDKITSTLSGRFLPLDPRDEEIIDLLVRDGNPFVSLEDVYSTEGPPVEVLEDGTTEQRKWSRRSEAARKRWADPAYRAKVLEKRAEKRRRNTEMNDGHKAKVEIGPVDSITLCNDDKAKAINDYARSNKLRSEKITGFHRNPKQWMENRLKSSPMRLSDEEYVNQKIEKRERRRYFALEREKRMKAEREGTSDDYNLEEGR